MHLEVRKTEKQKPRSRLLIKRQKLVFTSEVLQKGIVFPFSGFQSARSSFPSSCHLCFWAAL